MLPEYNRDVRYSALQENAIQVVGEDDNTWNDGDYSNYAINGVDSIYTLEDDYKLTTLAELKRMK